MEKLYQYPNMESIIIKKKQELEVMIKEKDEFMSNFPAYSMGVKTSKTNQISDPTFNTAYGAMKRFGEHLEHIKDEICYYCNTKESLDMAFRVMKIDEFEVIDYFYFRRMSYRQCCRELHISESTFTRRKKRAEEYLTECEYGFDTVVFKEDKSVYEVI